MLPESLPELHKSILSKDLDRTFRLINEGTQDLNEIYKGLRPIHCAILMNNLDVLKALMKKKVDTRTALMVRREYDECFITRGQDDIIAYLEEPGVIEFFAEKVRSGGLAGGPFTPLDLAFKLNANASRQSMVDILRQENNGQGFRHIELPFSAALFKRPHDENKCRIL
jgi:hypothetical protein